MNAYVQIKGTKPLLFHKFNVEALTSLKKPKSGSSGNDPEEWKTSFFYDGRNLYIPDHYIFSTLKAGAVHTKVGRGTIQKSWVAAVTVDTPKIYLGREIFEGWEEMEITSVPIDSSLPVYVDIRMVANPNTKGRNIRYRLAVSPNWEAKFDLTIDPSILSKQQVKKVIEDSGKLIGIADGRTLGYGRFTLESIDFS